MSGRMRIVIVAAALLLGASTISQARGRMPDELLATLPDTTVVQQQEIQRIERERRAAYVNLQIKQRAEQDRIDDLTAQQLRKALGDEGYRRYAEWKAAKFAERGRMHHGDGKRRHHGADGRGAPGAPPPPPLDGRDDIGEPTT